MKCATTVLLFVHAYLHRLREELPGKVTLTVASQGGTNTGSAPNVKGQNEDDAKQTLEDRGFSNIKTHRQSVNDQSQDGRVVDQQVDSNGKVDLYIGRYGNANNNNNGDDNTDGDFPGDRPEWERAGATFVS